jgi:NAD+ synthase (glutamine-hydrolysing)
MKIKALQMNLTVGDLTGNFANIVSEYNQAAEEGIDLVVTPETAITGYPPNDLLLRDGFVERQLQLLDELRKLTTGKKPALLVGAVGRHHGIGKSLTNSAYCFRNGKRIFKYNKQLLPTYNIFDESRYFEAGKHGQDNMFQLLGKNIRVVICEDAWNDEVNSSRLIYQENPLQTILPNDDLLITLNASPADIEKHDTRYKMYRQLSEKYDIPILYVNQVGGNDDLVFDGHSFYVDGDSFQYYRGWRSGDLRIDTDNNYSILEMPSSNRNEYIWSQLKTGLIDYVSKTGFEKVCIALSGGIDSAAVTILAAETLGPENVTCVMMPSEVSSEGSVVDSIKLCENLGIPSENVYTHTIHKQVKLACEDHEAVFGEYPKGVTKQNIQARIRGRIIMTLSNQSGDLVLTTGNKSEISVGYCTLYGDTCGGLAVIADLYKTEIYELLSWHNEDLGKEICPLNILEKPPSAELEPGQLDSNELPPYEQLDAILKVYIEGDLMTELERVTERIRFKDMTINQIEKIIRMVDRAEYKRKQLAPGIRVHNRAFGFGRNLPIAQRYPTDYRSVL